MKIGYKLLRPMCYTGWWITITLAIGKRKCGYKDIVNKLLPLEEFIKILKKVDKHNRHLFIICNPFNLNLNDVADMKLQNNILLLFELSLSKDEKLTRYFYRNYLKWRSEK